MAKKSLKIIFKTALITTLIFLFYKFIQPNINLWFENEFDFTLICYLVIFIPFYFKNYLKYIKFKKEHKFILLSNKSYNIKTGLPLIFLLFFLFFSQISNATYLTGIFLIITLILLYLEYLKTKRRTLIINKNGIKDLAKEKDRNLNEITTFDIHDNNIEIRFNKAEILQINKNDLLKPEWNIFVDDMKELKKHINFSQ